MKFIALGEDIDSLIMGLEDAIKKLREGYKQDYDYGWYLED